MHFNSIFCLFIVMLQRSTPIPIIGDRVLENPHIPYPFIVSLQLAQKFSNNTRYYHICGGSLLSSQWILSAAHCVYKFHPAILVAIVGELDLAVIPKAIKYEIVRIMLFDFQPGNMQNDIALLKMKEDYKSNVYMFHYAKLPVPNMKASKQSGCKAIGYGVTNSTGGHQEYLREAEVFVISKKYCRHQVGSIWAPKNTDNAFCALGVHQDTCQGDSGGPLLCMHAEEYLIYGIISYGVQCGLTGMPSIYTATIPFVERIVHLLHT